MAAAILHHSLRSSWKRDNFKDRVEMVPS
jgi:hypothetical protein